MSCSVRGAVLAAQVGRGNRNQAFASQEYQVILPQLPTGTTVLNTVFLHADPSARPYRVDDFRDALLCLGLLPDLIAPGAYQMNHCWAVTFKNGDGVKKLVAAASITVKERRCLVIDPGNQDVRLKLHWVLYNVPDDAVRAAFAPYGRVTDVAKEKWRVQGCAEKSSTTRTVSLKLKAGVSIDDLPHQLRVASDLALVVVPGRPPVCLRCQNAGHVRRECRVPRCSRCRRFGHDESACVKTYASVAGPVGGNDISEHLMDEVDAEEAANGGGVEVVTVAADATGNTANGDSDGKASSAVHGQETVPTAEESGHNSVVKGKPAVQSEEKAMPTGACEGIKVQPVSPVPSPEEEIAEDMDSTSTLPKRQREDSDDQTSTGLSANPDEPPPKAAPTRRSPYRKKPITAASKNPAATEPT